MYTPISPDQRRRILLETIYALGWFELYVPLTRIVRIPCQILCYTNWHFTGTVTLSQVMHKSYLYRYRVSMPTNTQ